MIRAFVLPLILVVVHAGIVRGQNTATNCLAVSDSFRTVDNWRPAPGEYHLTMVAVDSLHRGARASGPLLLWRTSASDSSPTTNARPARVDTVSTPLYGATTVDLPRVGVILSDDFMIPRPFSRDPLYPGILVHIQNWGRSGALRQSVLTVGTLTNVRAPLDYGMTDGPGAGLWVRQATADGFRGTWGPWGGLRASGYGYFCAVRRGPTAIGPPAG